MTDPDPGHPLPGHQPRPYAPDRVCHVFPKAVVLTGVNPDRKAGILLRHADQRTQQGSQIPDIVDFLPDDIAPGDIGIPGHRPQRPQVFPHEVVLRDPVLLDGQRGPPDRRQKPERHPGFCHDRGHNRMDLPEHFRGSFRLDQRCIGDFRVFDAASRVIPRDPEQLVLRQRIVPENRMRLIRGHLIQISHDFLIGDLFELLHGLRAQRILRSDALAENVPVQVYLFQIGEYGLSVLQDCQGGADPRKIPFRVFEVFKDQ